MDDMYNIFGTSAGKVYETLTTKGPMAADDLVKTTGLNAEQFNGVVGWLARENKLNKCEDNTFCIGETNMYDFIGNNAGKVWKVLDIWGEMDLASICRLTHMAEDETFQAIGWLAREGKVDGNMLSQYNTKKVFWLK